MSGQLEKYSHIVGGIYFGYNEAISTAIAEVLENMLDVEQEYFVNNCWVISIKKGASWPTGILQEKPWVVILSNDLTAEELPKVISAEFSHIMRYRNI